MGQLENVICLEFWRTHAGKNLPGSPQLCRWSEGDSRGYKWARMDPIAVYFVTQTFVTLFRPMKKCVQL